MRRIGGVGEWKLFQNVHGLGIGWMRGPGFDFGAAALLVVSLLSSLAVNLGLSRMMQRQNHSPFLLLRCYQKERQK